MGWIEVLEIGTEYEFTFANNEWFRGIVESVSDCIVTTRTKPDSRKRHFDIKDLRAADETGVHIISQAHDGKGADVQVSTRVFDPATKNWSDYDDEKQTDE